MKRSSFVKSIALPLLLCGTGCHPFGKHLDEYVNALDSEDLAREPGIEGEEYINGKVLLIDKHGATDFDGFDLEVPLGSWFVRKGRNRVDGLQRRLPWTLRAASPEEVGTVIWLYWGTSTCSSYTGGLHGYAVTCDAVVIDFLHKRVIADTSFVGECPESPDRTSRSFYGPPPDVEILEFVKGLGAKTDRETIDSVGN
jgi:hypothetical protein